MDARNPANHAPSTDVDEATVRKFVALIHEHAARALNGVANPGFLQLSRLHPLDNKLVTTRYQIGDVDDMAQQAIADARAGHNVYVEGRTISEQTPRGKRGGIEHTAFVFALVDDSDDDKGKAANRDLGNLASLVVETSPGNRHNWFFLKTAVTAEEAKPVGEAMRIALGSDSDTGTVTQPYRVAGTPNFPGKAKQKRGRTKVERTSIVDAHPDRSWTLGELLSLFPSPQPEKADRRREVAKSGIDWSVVESHAGWLRSVADLPNNFSEKGKVIIGHTGSLAELCENLQQAGLTDKRFASWSEVTMSLAAIFNAQGSFTNEKIAAALMCPLVCNQHVMGKAGPQQRRAVERALTRSHHHGQSAASAVPWRERLPSGLPRATMHNARLAIRALGIECRSDIFHHRTLVGYKGDATQHELQSVVGEVTDDAILRLRQILSDQYGVDFGERHVRDAVMSLAVEHRFDPVCDLLAKAEAEWDRKERLDRMAVDYFNAKDTELNRAIMRKTMIALVRRARHPGCKFDTITVLESPEGWDKSGAWRAIAGEENFSDQSILGCGGREVQEQLADVWLHESADLAGLRKSEVEAVKAFASRQVDIARPAYGRTVVRQPRHSICVGTTNDDEYLQSQTGNRRFWPIKVGKRIDLEKLRADRLQLLGEAAYYESQGESITLDENLWEAARKEQEKRRVKDDWEDILARMPGQIITWREARDIKIKIVHSDTEFEYVATNDILTYLLERPVGRRENYHSIRLSKVMRCIGWQRTPHGKVTIDGKQVRGYYRPRDGILTLVNKPATGEPSEGE
jgi:hypothetical protein